MMIRALVLGLVALMALILGVLVLKKVEATPRCEALVFPGLSMFGCVVSWT